MTRKDLRLVLVHTRGEGSDLVSLTLRSVLASCDEGEEMTAGTDIPVVHIEEKEIYEAREMCGLPRKIILCGRPEWGWPGWDTIFTWLETKLP
jgi:hypothetical protein